MLAAALISLYADWVPARWPSSDPKSLDLLAGTPINCLWLEPAQWSAPFLEEAARRGIATVAVIRREGDPVEAAQTAAKMKFDAAVAEGDFDDYTALIVAGAIAKSKKLLIESVSRSRMRFDGDSPAASASAPPIIATYQGLWPGIHVEAGGAATAGPTANPWIDTNTGFLRFAHASTDSVIWLANRPPPKTVIPASHYLQAIGDAWMNGARWVVELDDDFSQRLMAREAKAMAAWRQIAEAIAHYEEHREWRGAQPTGGVAVVEDISRARLSAGLFDMLAAKHLPIVAVPISKIATSPALRNASVAVETDPSLVGAAERKVLESFSAGGGKLVLGPAPTRALERPEDVFTYDPADARVATIWELVDEAVGTRNLGVRLFNVASMLANVLATRAQRQLVLHLVNYSDYPAQGVTVRLRGVYRHARLYRPGEAPIDVDVYKTEDGTGIDIDQRFLTIATLVIE